MIIDLPAKGEKRWSTGRIRAIAKLQFYFLQISPSYELANRILNENEPDLSEFIRLVNDLYRPKKERSLTDTQNLEVFGDFMKVIKLRTQFGNLSDITFEQWWKDVGGWYYGFQFEEPKIRLVTTFDEGESKITDDMLLVKYHQYISQARTKENNPKSLLVSIPMCVPKHKLLKQLDELIEENKTARIPIVPDKHPFELKRLRIDALIKSLFVLKSWAMLESPIQLWKFAFMTKISPKNLVGLDIYSRPTKANLDQRNTLAILMHRSLTEAQYIAENAAHGIFSSRKKCLLPQFNQAEVNDRMNKLNSFQENNSVAS